MRALLALLLLVPAAAQTGREERGKQLVMEALEALGGQSFLAMRDRVETGMVYSFYRRELSGLSRATIYTRYLTPSVPPDPTKLWVRERQAFGRDEDYAVLFDEEKGWEITFRGARPVPDDTLARYRDTTRRNFFYILRQRLDEPGLIFEYQGTDVVDNQPVAVVDIIDSQNNTTTLYFSLSEKLPLKQLFYRRNPATRQRHEEVTRFSKYRDAGGGVLWPMNITRLRDGEKVYEIFSETVSVNQTLPDPLFALSPDARILPPAR